MTKIGIDARLLLQTGVGVYIRNLLINLDKIADKDYKFLIYLRNSEINKINFKSPNFEKRVADFAWHSWGEQTGFLRLIQKDGLDLAHFTYFSYPVLYRRDFVATIHDLTPLLFKTGKASTRSPIIYRAKYSVFRYVLSSQVRNAKSIITPSRSVKNMIVDYFGETYKNKIFPVYEGIDERLKEIKAQKPSGVPVGADFLLYVGNFYPHKNVGNLIQAYAKVSTDSKLVLVGPNDFFAKDIVKLIQNLKQQKRIVLFYNPSSANFAWLYKHAKALVHPSLYEGFGLPIAEACYFDLPIIASDIPTFDELLGGNYVKFNPKDPSDIAGKIDLFLKNKHDIKFDYSRILSKLSFKKMAEATYRLYERCL